jgi:hypothetical protein
MMHSLVSQFDGVNESLTCMRCGATYFHSEYGTCSGRTDLVHGEDVSSHSLDGCSEFDETGECNHLAWTIECDCSLCNL